MIIKRTSKQERRDQREDFKVRVPKLENKASLLNQIMPKLQYLYSRKKLNNRLRKNLKVNG
jgi:hypothetical protein